MNKCYSVNEEEYMSLEDAVDRYLDDNGMDWPEGDSRVDINLSEGESVAHDHSDFLRVDWMLEQMQEAAFEDCGEWADGYLDDMCKEKRESLKEHIVEWMNENVASPHFYTVKNIKEVRVEVMENTLRVIHQCAR